MRHTSHGRVRAVGLLIGSLLSFCVQAQVANAGEVSEVSLSGLLSEDSASYQTGCIMVRFAEPLRPALGDQAWLGPRTRGSIQTLVAGRILPGAVVVRDLGAVVPGLTTVRLPAGVSVQEAISRFNGSAYVLYAEPNYRLKLCYMPLDAWFDSQWALNNTGQSIRVPGIGTTPLAPGLRGADINAPEGWDVMGTGANAANAGNASQIIVAVLDTGIDYNHPDLAANIWSKDITWQYPDPNFVANPSDPNAPTEPNMLTGTGTIYGTDTVDNDNIPIDGNNGSFDEHWHGTAVAGIIGATWDNTAIAGVCKGVQLMGIRITDGNDINMDSAVAGMAWAQGEKASIFNCSWGTQSWPQGLYDAISAAGKAKITVVAAAGSMFEDPNVPATNMDDAPFYPAGFGTVTGSKRGAPLDNVISVMASDRYDRRPSYSNWGPGSVHLAAPGDALITLVPQLGTAALTSSGIPFVAGSDQSEGIGLVSGTSFAAPHVTGACALALAMNPGLTPVKLRFLISSKDAVDQIFLGQNMCMSEGRLDLAKFLKMAQAGKVRNLRSRKEYSGLTPITDAMKEAVTGDTLVADTGFVYAEPTIDFQGKNVILKSGKLNASGVGPISPKTTTILWYDEAQAKAGRQQSATSPTVQFKTGETSSALLTGFTVKGGSAGVKIQGASPKVEKCIIRENTQEGGVSCTGGKPNVVNCEIQNNASIGFGGGILCTSKSEMVVTDCNLTSNVSVKGGGGIQSDGGSTIQIVNTNVRLNSATDGWGGGVTLDGADGQVTKCQILGNQSRWQGGGVFVSDSTSVILDCQISSNLSQVDGGGLYYDQAKAKINLQNTTLASNHAYYAGGAVSGAFTSGLIQNCLITDNVSEGFGGGALHLWGSSVQVSSCTFARNSCLAFETYGGALFMEQGGTSQIRNSIFMDNNDVAIAQGDSASKPSLQYCLFYANAQGDYRQANGRQFVVTDPALSTVITSANNLAGNPMFVRGKLGSYYLSNSGAGQILDSLGRVADPNVTPGTQASDANSPAIDAGSDLASTLGMDQVSTRTDNEKDTGRVDIGFHYNDPQPGQTYSLQVTVSPDGAGDLTPNAITAPLTFKQFATVYLTARATDPNTYQFKGWQGTDNDAKIELDSSGYPLDIQHNFVTMDGNKFLVIGYEATLIELRARITGTTSAGTINPERIMVRRGSKINLVVTLKDNHYAIRWTGSDDDLARVLTNTVTVQAPYTLDPRGREFKEVTARLFKPRTITMGPGGIDRMIEEAQDGDILVLPPGQHMGSTNSLEPLYIYRDVTLTSSNPDDLSTAAGTIIKDYILYIYNSNVVVEGLTFTNACYIYVGACSPTIRNCRFVDCTWHISPTINASQAPDDGGDGGSVYGGAMVIQGDMMGLIKTSPKIQNCSFIGCNVWGGNGAPGDNGTGQGTPPHTSGFDGGWGGYGYGGAVYMTTNATPTFDHCTFEGNWARGGDGGDGGNGIQGDQGGRGGMWNWAPTMETMLTSGDPNIFWDGAWLNGAHAEYWKYSGYGGAVYCQINSSPKFTNCNFGKNWCEGGLSGIGSPTVGGTRFPRNHYRIDSFGGAVYGVRGSNLEFVDCNFTYNYASRALEPNTPLGNNATTEPTDVYTSFGGGLMVEDDCHLKMTNCRLQGDYATLGGAIYAKDGRVVLANTSVVDCNAYQGGGVYTQNCTGAVEGSTFSKNRAEFVPQGTRSATDPNVVAVYFNPGIIDSQGGGYYSASSPVSIKSSVFTNNYATYSGGGVYYMGNDGNTPSVTPLLHDSLLTGNEAGRDGGAVSVNWYTKVKISNSTLSANRATGSFGTGAGMGGGLYCGYDSDVEVVDSILWKNIGVEGAQVAVANGFEFGARPSRLRIQHTTIGPDYVPDTFQALNSTTSQTTTQTGGSGMGTATSTSAENQRLVDGDSIYSQFTAGKSTVNVIVMLKDNAALRLATSWGDAESETALRTDVASRQQQVLAKLSTAQVAVTHRYQNIPGFAAAVTKNGLDRLLSDSTVTSIEPVRKMCYQLSQALSLGNAMEIRETYSGKGISVAICDSGVDYTHPMLGGGGFPNAKVIGGFDTGENDADPRPRTVAHGTCCAGIAAGALAVYGDYAGGVAPEARIYALKISDVNEAPLTSAAVAAWDWCITHRNDNPAFPIKAISNSWAGGSYATRLAADAAQPALAAAARAAVTAGITVLGAAGNDGTVGTISAPAALSNVIAVGALYDTSSQVASYSDSSALVDILAPADPVYTTDIVGVLGYDPGDYYDSFNGTSSATPFVAGAVASIQSAAWQRLHRYLTPAEVRTLLVSTGDPVNDSKSGLVTPRINLGAALAGPYGYPIRVEKGCQIGLVTASESADYVTWNTSWDPNSSMLTADPCFVEGYYLANIAAGQSSQSPCVDAGSLLVSDPNVLLADLTTRTDGVKDAGLVDLGYHYGKGLTAYRLTVSVQPAADGLPHGSVQASAFVVYEGSASNVVTLRAIPDKGYKVKQWTGTDDNASTALVNRVTVTKDTAVTVQFEAAATYQFKATVLPSKDGLIHGQLIAAVLDADGEPNTIDVSSGPVPLYDGTAVRLIAVPNDKYELTAWRNTDNDVSKALINTATIRGKDVSVTVEFQAKVVRTLTVPGQYRNIQQAVDAASDGDTVLVDPGTYYGADSGNSSYSIVVSKGITITSRNPDDPCCVAATIIDGYSTLNPFHNMGVVFIPGTAGQASVLNGITIQNCGGAAGTADDGDRTVNHPDGYDGSGVYGGGIWVYTGASPVIKNCIIRNNWVQGGDAGNGVASSTTENAGRGGWAGYGWGGGAYIMPNGRATFINCTFEGNQAIGGNAGNGGNGTDNGGLPNWGGNYSPDSNINIDPAGLSYTVETQPIWQVWGYVADYRYYSGYGGGVFCDASSQVDFVHCVIRNNRSTGGLSGVGGQQPPVNRNLEPLIAYEIPSYGGGVYCAANSAVTFTGCTLEDNTASQLRTGTDPNHTLTPYLGYGGGVAAESNAKLRFVDCNIVGNLADSGGGVYAAGITVEVTDCNLSTNAALRGGGLLGQGGLVTVSDCNVVNNRAQRDPNDPNNTGQAVQARA